MPENWQTAGFGLYLHWPFCSAKCPYCDFNSHVTASVDHDAWADALVYELERAAKETPGRVLSSIFFGGGTPSLMSPRTVERIITSASTIWSFSNDIEITLEANPTSVEAGKFKSLASAGVNRFSLGIQALNNADLRHLGRMHSADEARAALETAQNTVSRVSFDLIYARQHQSLSDWASELKYAVSLGTCHLSLYQLTIEPDTAFARRLEAGNLSGLPKDDLAADMYEATQEICDAAGLHAYEVSNHARAGERSRHNLIYWHYGDYVGVGPGAHGRLSKGSQRIATEHTPNPSEWLSGPRERPREYLSVNDIAREMLLMGLRVVDGIDVKRWKSMTGYRLQEDKLLNLQADGWINYDGTTLRVNKDHFILLNSVLSRVADCVIQS